MLLDKIIIVFTINMHVNDRITIYLNYPPFPFCEFSAGWTFAVRKDNASDGNFYVQLDSQSSS